MGCISKIQGSKSNLKPEKKILVSQKTKGMNQGLSDLIRRSWFDQRMGRSEPHEVKSKAKDDEGAWYYDGHANTGSRQCIYAKTSRKRFILLKKNSLSSSYSLNLSVSTLSHSLTQKTPFFLHKKNSF
jgi:hypothetical protein